MSSDTSYLPLAPLPVPGGNAIWERELAHPPLSECPQNPLPFPRPLYSIYTHTHLVRRQSGTHREREADTLQWQQAAPQLLGCPAPPIHLPPTSEPHEEVHQYGATQPGQRLQGQAVAAEESAGTGEGRPEAEGPTRVD